MCEAARAPSKPLLGRGFILSQSGTKAKFNARVIYQNGDILTVNKKAGWMDRLVRMLYLYLSKT